MALKISFPLTISGKMQEDTLVYFLKHHFQISDKLKQKQYWPLHDDIAKILSVCISCSGYDDLILDPDAKLTKLCSLGCINYNQFNALAIRKIAA